MKLLITLLLAFNLTVAISAEQMTVLQKGQKAPYKGVLSNSDQMKKFRKAHEEKELCIAKSGKQSELQKIQELEKDFYKEKHKSVEKEFNSYKKKSFWEKTGFFLLGVAITGIVSYGAMKYGPRR